MKLFHTISGNFAVNTYYLVVGNDAIVIDGGVDGEEVLSYARTNGFTVKYMLLTHTHFDHATSAKYLQDNGVKIVVSALEADGLQDDDLNASNYFGLKFEHLTPDITFNDGEVLDLLGLKIKCIITPGHSKGSSCFIVDNLLFSGDTLFNEGVGRFDLKGGSGRALLTSLKRLLALDFNYTVYPGHGEATSIEHEKIYNPYV
ncbi:MAG: MBL fold metallo-hydrolase [Clostridia bacterium]|nr:MBL fold metallo-hydrolase [Clostridia bacterium]